MQANPLTAGALVAALGVAVGTGVALRTRSGRPSAAAPFDDSGCTVLTQWLARAQGEVPATVGYPAGSWTVSALAGGETVKTTRGQGTGDFQSALAEAGRQLAVAGAPATAPWLALRIAPGKDVPFQAGDATWGCFSEAAGGERRAWQTYRDHAALTAPSRAGILRSLRLAARYLLHALKPDGNFVYEYQAATGKESDDYNVLRHAGTALAILQLEKVLPDPALRAAADRALANLKERLVACPPPGAAALCVAEDGETKLGGNALAAVALAERARLTGSGEDLPVLRGLVRRIVALEAASGEFTGHKQTLKNGRFLDFTSSYYPGEALLALLRVGALAKEQSLVDAAARGARYLAEVRDKGKGPGELEHDHWLLYALKDLYAVRPEPWIPAHARRLVEAIADAQNLAPTLPQDWRGSWYAEPRSAPAATRAEGLLAAEALLKAAGDSDGAAIALAAARRAWTFQMATQIGPEAALYLATPAQALGGFRAAVNDPTVRIDFVQHNVSAMIALLAVTQGP